MGRKSAASACVLPSWLGADGVWQQQVIAECSLQPLAFANILQPVSERSVRTTGCAGLRLASSRAVKAQPTAQLMGGKLIWGWSKWTRCVLSIVSVTLVINHVHRFVVVNQPDRCNEKRGRRAGRVTAAASRTRARSCSGMMNIPRRQPPSRPNCTDSRAHTTPHEVTLHTEAGGDRCATKKEALRPGRGMGSEVECDAPSVTTGTVSSRRRGTQEMGHHWDKLRTELLAQCIESSRNCLSGEQRACSLHICAH